MVVMLACVNMLSVCGCIWVCFIWVVCGVCVYVVEGAGRELEAGQGS